MIMLCIRWIFFLTTLAFIFSALMGFFIESYSNQYCRNQWTMTSYSRNALIGIRSMSTTGAVNQSTAKRIKLLDITRRCRGHKAGCRHQRSIHVVMGNRSTNQFFYPILDVNKNNNNGNNFIKIQKHHKLTLSAALINSRSVYQGL